MKLLHGLYASYSCVIVGQAILSMIMRCHKRIIENISFIFIWQLRLVELNKCLRFLDERSHAFYKKLVFKFRHIFIKKIALKSFFKNKISEF